MEKCIAAIDIYICLWLLRRANSPPSWEGKGWTVIKRKWTVELRWSWIKSTIAFTFLNRFNWVVCIFKGLWSTWSTKQSLVSMLLRISIVRLKSPKTYIHTCDNCKSFNETDSGGRLRQTTYSRVTASSELFGASPHSNINALAVAISFSFVFVLITLFKLRITQSIYFI